MAKSGDAAKKRNDKHVKELARATDSIEFPNELEGSALVRISHQDGERSLYVFLLPNYDAAKIPAFEGAIEKNAYSNDKTMHRSLRLRLAGGKRSVGIAVNDGLLRIIPEDFDIIKVNDLNQVNKDIAIRELGKAFSQRGKDRSPD